MLGRGKMIIMAANCQPNFREAIIRHSKISEIPIFHYKGRGKDLGIVCGRRHVVSALTVKDPGNSEVLKLVEA